MLRRGDRHTRIHQTNRHNDQISLAQQAPNKGIPPFQYIHPSTDLLGTNTPALSDYDIGKSEIDIRNSTPEPLIDSRIETSSNSISLHTICLYKRLEGRWEEPRPSDFHQRNQYQQW